jgi:dTDP-3-amino-3,4,6-trideoxy-alpha-D-glucose transaminase
VSRHVQRDAIRHHLEQLGVSTMIHYPVPPHRSPAFRSGNWVGGDLRVTERIANEILSLPMGPHLSASQAECVVDGVRAFVSNQRRAA